MKKRERQAFVLAALACLLILGQPGRGAGAPPVAVPPAGEILAPLRREHPRLLAPREEFVRLKERIGTDAQLGRWHAALRDRAQRMLAEPPSRYEIPDGLRLLATSRRVLDRVYTLALLYRLDGDRRWVERTWTELQAAAAFPDWNPRHFLDTAEMTHAFAIGYDWLYDAWSPAQREVLRTAIAQKGLQPAQEAYRGEGRNGWWVRAHHNWNQVCNGGIGMGALALADELPDQAGAILHAGLESLRLPMERYAPDGGWEEGSGYWHYATFYNVTFLAALDSALGTDFGLANMPGFAGTGLFPLYLTGPAGRTFNYADGGDGAIRAPELFWLARRFHRPAYAAYERRLASPHSLDLLWYDAALAGEKSPPLSLDRHFRGVEVVTFRTSWNDPNALFLAFKGGDNRANHSHLDLGSFVLDALGQRWALDLGAENYNLPAYFGKDRWTYYRTRAEGHNTLLIQPDAGPDQDPAATAAVIRFRSAPERAFAVADLTAAYRGRARRARRGVAMLDRRQVLVQDEVETVRPGDLWWFMHTRAEGQVDEGGVSATLRLGEQRLWARLLSPQGARFSLLEALPLPSSPHPAGQNPNTGIRKLAIRIENAREARLAVLLVPLRPGEEPPTRLPELSPLVTW
jgi:hypothetical protein